MNLHTQLNHRLLAAMALTLSCTIMSAPPLHVVVSTSMLEAAVKDVGLDADRVAVTCLVPPGSCPGHFDVSPGVVPVLRRASLLVLHDYQKALAHQIRILTGKNVRIVSVSERGSLLIPDAYAALVDDVAALLQSELPSEREQIARGQQQTRHLVKDIETSLRRRARSWTDTPVIASAQQQAFCEWLGLDVIGVLPRPEDLSPKQLSNLGGLKAAFLVANLQSDADAARVLADRMNLPVAVLSNFPEHTPGERPYRQLFKRNLDQLDDAWHSRN